MSEKNRIINPKWQEACEKLLADTDIHDTEKYQSVKKFIKGEIEEHPDFKFNGEKWIYEKKEHFINVFCCMTGHKYNLDYVRKLRNMVNRNLTIEHNFICLSDKAYYYSQQPDTKGIIFENAVISMPDSWCKLSLFSPTIEMKYKGKALYFDLDVVIIDNIDKLVANEDIDKEDFTRFTIIQDWNRPTYNSSMMIWEIGKMNFLFNNFRASDIKAHRGDQDLITKLLKESNYLVNIFDKKKVKSYKSDNCKNAGNVLKPTKVVVFHGKPKPAEFADQSNWITKNWR